MGTFSSDVSKYQRIPVDDSYPYPLLIQRIGDGSFPDTLWPANSAWSKKSCDTGRMVGFGGYYVSRPYQMSTDAALQFIQAQVKSPHQDFFFMQDVESWGGAIGGDHSTYFTDLHDKVCRWLSSRLRSIGYGNGGDLRALWSDRPTDLRLIVASYGLRPSFPGMIGWQFADGDPRWGVPAGWSRTAAPWGPCDQNYFDLSPVELARALGLGSNSTSIEEEVMAFYNNKTEFQADLRAQSAAGAAVGVWGNGRNAQWWLWRLILALGARHPNSAFSAALLDVYKPDGKTLDPVASQLSHATYGFLFDEQGNLNLSLAGLHQLLQTSVTGPPSLLYRRPSTGVRMFQPVNDGAERRWVSGALAATWPNGFQVIDLPEDDPFWDLPSLTLNAENNATRIEALDASQDHSSAGVTTP